MYAMKITTLVTGEHTVTLASNHTQLGGLLGAFFNGRHFGRPI